MGFLKMTRIIGKLALLAFILLSPRVYAQQLSELSHFKSNPDGSQTLLNHVPSEVVQGKAARILQTNLNQILDLRIVLPPKDPAGLTSFIKELYDPKSPFFHKFLTPTQFNQQFGASSVDSASVIAYLKSQGLTVVKQSSNGFFLTVSGKVSTIQSAFKVNISNYKASDGTAFFAPDSNPTIPPQMTGKIMAIVGMDNAKRFHPHYHQTRRIGGVVKAGTLAAKTAVNPKATKAAAPQFSGVSDGTNPTIAPSDILTAYNIDPLTNSSTPIIGTGQNVALVELDGYTPGDINEFTSQSPDGYVLTQVPPISVVPVDGGISSLGDGSFESDLDIDLVVAIAPGLSNIYVYEAPNTEEGWVDAWSDVASEDIANSISCSWGNYEADSFMSFDYDYIFSQLAAQGQTVFAAAGDSGAYDNCSNSTLQPGCTDDNGNPITHLLTVEDPASDQYITGVGISILSTGAGETWSSETASPQGGGGVSSYVSVPSWQQAATTHAFTLYNAGNGGASCTSNCIGSQTMRNVPDVVFTAGPTTQYLIYWTDPAHPTDPDYTGWYYAWGSSAASPIWSAFIARVDQGRPSYNPIGYLNPVLYSIAQDSVHYASDFHDITSGNNSYYSAETGYDDAAGLGSLNGANLYADLLGPAAPSLNPTSGSGEITLNWAAVSGASSYNVYKATSSGGENYSTPANVLTNSYTDSSVSNGHTYYYVVRSVNAFGADGANSSEVSATPASVTYNVTVTQPSNGAIGCGSISGSCPGAPVGSGTQITFFANPNSGFGLSSWSVTGGTPQSNCSSATTGQCTVTISSDTTVTATFIAAYTVTVNTPSNGTITCGSTSGTCPTTQVDTGTQIVFYGNSNPGFGLSSWSVSGSTPGSDCSGTTGTCTVTITGTTTVGATFTSIPESLTVNYNPTDGSVTCNSVTCTSPVNGGSTIIFSAAPNSGYTFTGWTVSGSTAGAGCSGTGTCSVLITTPTTVTANFVQTFTVSVTQPSNGSINCGSFCPTTVDAGTVITFDADPNTGYEVSGWTVGGGTVQSGCSSSSTTCTVTVNANTTVTASFVVIPVQSPSALKASILAARVAGHIIYGGVILNWTQSTTSGVVQNKIYRAVGSGGYSLYATVSRTTSYTDKTLTKGTSYNYEVTAYTSGGAESAPSNSAAVAY